jgi:hypothetical protein
VYNGLDLLQILQDGISKGNTAKENSTYDPAATIR